MRRACAVDAPQPDIVKALRRCGYRVHVTSTAGDGFPDLVLGAPWGQIVLVEVKDGSKPPSARRLTSDQQQFHLLWAGFPLLIVESVADCITKLEHLRQAWERK